MGKPFSQFTALIVLTATVLISGQAQAESEIYIHQFRTVTGFAFEKGEGKPFRVSTPHGIFEVMENGRSKKISHGEEVFIELVSHPGNPKVLFSSGYKSEKEKLGIVRSVDGGVTWNKISDGAKGPVDFYAMAISRKNPAIMYGVSNTLQTSRDGGKTWEILEEIPGERIYDISVSSLNSDTVYAGTRNGMYISRNAGKDWLRSGEWTNSVTAVRTTPSGQLYAFVYGKGLMTANEAAPKWKLLSEGFNNRALIDIAVDPNNKGRLLGVADTGAAMISKDGGKTWGSYEGHLKAIPDRIAAGKKLYEENCVACHGEKGIGEKPGDPMAVDDNGLPVAPALDDSMHGWHHSDEQLMATILEGSPRNERMQAWKENGISQDDAEDIVAYIKSLWSFTSLSCQGPRHMSCMH